MTGFKYTPLTLSRSTRLVKFKSDGLTTGINCQAFEQDLDDAPEAGYTALSYCWGNPHETSLITLNGYPFHVTKNLCAALTVLSASYDSNLFWIDAICIDQSNVQERNTQVLMMREIYEQANRVIIWLGTGDLKTTVTMRWVEKVCCFWTSLISTHGTDEIMLYDMCAKGIGELFDSLGEIIDFSSLHGLVQLLTSPWFERVWIVQESTTPRKEMLVQCGHAAVLWTSLITATKITTHLLLRPELRNFFANAPSIDNQIMRRLFNIEKQRQFEKPVLSLLQILAKYRHFDATDQRDKIYALRGLAADLSGNELLPDYSLTTQAVFTQVAQHLIISKRSFGCLGYCDYSTRGPRQPTWVPNWGTRVTRHPLAKRRVHDGSEPQPPVYRAAIWPPTSNKNRQWMCEVRQGHVLAIAGFRIDIVDRVAHFVTPDAPNPPGASSCEDGAFTGAPAIYGLDIPNSQMYRDSSEPLKTAYARTVVADVAKTGNLRIRGFEVTLDHWRRVHHYTHPPTDPRHRKEWGSFMFSTASRCLFWSREAYLGLGPVDVRPGDQICAFFGSDVLHVLRPVEGEESGGGGGGTFHLIGECYVHGLMDGEARSLLDDEIRNVEVFAVV